MGLVCQDKHLTGDSDDRTLNDDQEKYEIKNRSKKATWQQIEKNRTEMNEK